MRPRTIALCTLALTGCPLDVPEPTPFSGTPRVRILVNVAPHEPETVEEDADEARYGDPLHVIVDGVEPGRVIIVESVGGAGRSLAHFVVGEDAIVDLARDAPIDEGDSWQGADGEAFVSTMVDPPDGPLDLSLTVRVLDADNGSELASDTLVRRSIDDGLVIEPVDDGTAQGLLALPPGDGPFPAVLVFGGSEGGTGTGSFNAMYLASLGYAALGVGYFGARGLPAELSEVPLEILENDLLRLAADPRIDPTRIAVMGGSRGGELALLVGATFSTNVRAVIALVPSGYVWPSVGEDDRAAWTLAGAPVPFVPSTGALAEVTVDDDGPHYRSRTAFLADIAAADAQALEAATIRAEDIAGPVLFLAGADDQLWPSCPMADVAVARRARADDEVRCFAGAGHAGVGIPGWSSVGSNETFLADFDAWLVLGGDAQANGRAIRDGDTAMRGFLARVLD